MEYSYFFHTENLSKHSVSESEVRECFSDKFRVVREDSGHYLLIGRTAAGRYLHIRYRIETGSRIFVFHAMSAPLVFKKIYWRRGK